MSVRMFHIFVLVFLFASVSARLSHCDDAKPPKGGGYVAVILKNADELKLTDEQKTKLRALAKDPLPKTSDEKKAYRDKIETILTPEQMTQMKTLGPKKKDK